MTNPNLPQAIAALLPKASTLEILNVLAGGASPAYSSLAFECHKALRAKYTWCSIFTDGLVIGYGYGNKMDEDGALIDIVSGFYEEGDKDEEAIFAAVLDWWEKNCE